MLPVVALVRDVRAVSLKGGIAVGTSELRGY